MGASRRALAVVFASLAALSCVSFPAERLGLATVELPGPRLVSAAAAPGDVAGALLAAGEDSWLGTEPGKDDTGEDTGEEASDATTGEGMTLRLAAGTGGAGGQAVGSAPGRSLPVYSEMWTDMMAFDVTADFPASGKVRPFARFSLTKLFGKVWFDPADALGVWQASEATMLAFSGGVRLGGGDKKPYARVGAGLLVWPETSQENVFTGESTTMFASKAGFAFSLGGGIEAALLGMKGFVDLDYLIGPSPEAAPEADGPWPGFQPGGSLGLLTITGGMKIAF